MGIAIGCMGLPLQAKGIAPVSEQPVAPAKTNKTETKSVASSNKPATGTTAPAKDKTVASTTTKDSAKSTTSKTSTSSAKAVASTSTARSTSTSSSRSVSASTPHTVEGGRLARLTAYWSGEGDYYTGRGMSSTGIHLHNGHCAVDPRIIPYGSIVTIDGVGKYLAVDTGSAVISREAAKETGHNEAERNALVIDIYFESRAEGERFSAGRAKFANISWTSPTSVSANTTTTSSLTE